VKLLYFSLKAWFFPNLRSLVAAATLRNFRDHKGHLNQINQIQMSQNLELNKTALYFLKPFTEDKLSLSFFLQPMNMVILHKMTYLHDKDVLFPWKLSSSCSKAQTIRYLCSYRIQDPIVSGPLWTRGKTKATSAPHLNDVTSGHITDICSWG